MSRNPEPSSPVSKFPMERLPRLVPRPLEKNGLDTFGMHPIGVHPAYRSPQPSFGAGGLAHSVPYNPNILPGRQSVTETVPTGAVAGGGPEPIPEPMRAYNGSSPSLSTPASTTPLLRLNTAAAAVAVRKRAASLTEWKPNRRQWCTMISLSFISFVVSLDATILVTALPEMSHSLHGSSAETFWTGTSYLLTSAVFQPVIASAAYCFSRRRLLIESIRLFTYGTILCALAHDFTVMLIGRCVQGVGGGGIIALTQVIFCDMVPLRQRPQYFSMVLGAWSVGSIIGPVVGGSLAETLSWRWCFYINFPFCGVGLVAVIRYVRSDDDCAGVPFQGQARQMDWRGALLFVTSIASLLVGISWGGTQYPWASAATLVPIFAGVLGMAAFVAWQARIQPNGLLPMTLFYNVSSVAAFYCAFVSGLILFTALYYVPFYMMSVQGSSAIRAGIDLFPAVFLLVPGSVAVAMLTSHYGRFRWAVWSGWGITIVACGLFMLADDGGKLVLALALGVFGVGCGMVLTGVNVATQAISKLADRGMAACMYVFMRSVGMPVGIVLSGAIFQNAMRSALASAGLPTGIAQDSERFIFVLRAMAADDPWRIAAVESYTKGFHAVFVAMTAMSASALAVSFLIKSFSMDAVGREGDAIGWRWTVRRNA